MECLVNVTNTCVGITDVGGLLLLQLVKNLVTSKLSMKPDYPPDRANDFLSTYDFIVVGAGSGGAPVAAGLAKKTNWNILLIEAGDDPNLSSEIPLMFPSLSLTSQDFGYLVEPQNNSCKAFKNNKCAWPRGKVLGGCSAINAMVYHQGNPIDYDKWEEIGNVGWAWKNVQKYFDEQMDVILKPQDYDKNDDDILTRAQEVILKAGKETGIDVLTDNEKITRGHVGAYKAVGTVENGQRKSAAKAFLVPIAKQKNFHVIKNAFVTKLIINSSRKQVTGVEVFLKNKFIQINVNKEVILSAGAINTPQILLLSGIGPKSHLQELGIPVIKDLPVGQHLQDHPSVMLPLTIFEDTSDEYENIIENNEVYKYFTTGTGVLSRIGTGNVVIYISPKNSMSKIGEISLNFLLFPKNDRTLLKKFLSDSNFNDNIISKTLELNKNIPIIIIFNVLLRPKSEGVLRLKTTNPFDPPLIDPNTNSVKEDLEELVGGIRYIQKLLNTNIMKENKAKLIDFELDECKNLKEDSDEYWICIIKQFTATLYHPVGTSRMGVDPNNSVVGPRLKVHSINGLRVADCSIMPSIVGGNTNAPCMMIGSKTADLIKDDWTEVHNEF